MPTISQRRLPHRDLGQHPVHVIYRLRGSIPKVQLGGLQEWYNNELCKLEQVYPLRESVTQEQELFEENLELITAEYEQNYDQLLDEILSGPTWLRNSDIAEIVGQSWLTIQDMSPVQIAAYCIMPNHVHVILQSTTERPVSLGKQIGSHKKFTARRCNRILKQKGTFWGEDYFDRNIRSGKFLAVLAYVLNNPVKAKLVSDWQNWPYTYLHPSWREELLGTAFLESES